MKIEKFWELNESCEFELINKILRRRFPETFSFLTECFDTVDPLQLVHPGNPDEYIDVIREMIVLLAPFNGELGELSINQLDSLVRESLTRCFDGIEDEAEGRTQQLVALIASAR
jgi:hypothetical protein